jgi:hypothetical protein
MILMCPCIIDFIGGRMDYKGEWGEGALDTPGPLNRTREAPSPPLTQVIHSPL